jgi:hypothetical protein
VAAVNVDLEALARDLDAWQKTINTHWLETFRSTGRITGEYEGLFALGLTLTGAASQARAIQLNRYERAHPEPFVTSGTCTGDCSRVTPPTGFTP